MSNDGKRSRSPRRLAHSPRRNFVASPQRRSGSSPRHYGTGGPDPKRRKGSHTPDDELYERVPVVQRERREFSREQIQRLERHRSADHRERDSSPLAPPGVSPTRTPSPTIPRDVRGPVRERGSVSSSPVVKRQSVAKSSSSESEESPEEERRREKKAKKKSKKHKHKKDKKKKSSKKAKKARKQSESDEENSESDSEGDDFEEKERLLRERALQSMKNREKALANPRTEKIDSRQMAARADSDESD